MISFFYDSYRLILFFLIPGIILGAIYDVFRISRMARSNPKGSIVVMLRKHFNLSQTYDVQHEQKKNKLERIIVFLEDFIFCTMASLMEILLFYHLNGGVIRVYAIFISVLGFVLYKITLERLVMLLAKNIIYVFRRILYFLLCVILSPLVFIGKRLYRLKKKHKKEKDEEMI